MALRSLVDARPLTKVAVALAGVSLVVGSVALGFQIERDRERAVQEAAALAETEGASRTEAQRPIEAICEAMSAGVDGAEPDQRLTPDALFDSAAAEAAVQGADRQNLSVYGLPCWAEVNAAMVEHNLLIAAGRAPARPPSTTSTGSDRTAGSAGTAGASGAQLTAREREAYDSEPNFFAIGLIEGLIGSIEAGNVPLRSKDCALLRLFVADSRISDVHRSNASAMLREPAVCP